MADIGLLEDNTKISHLCATMLRYVGHNVKVYECPSDFLQALEPPVRLTDLAEGMLMQPRTINAPIKLLVLDLNLPEIGGIGILKLLQSNHATRSLPLIFCTAASDLTLLSEAFDIAPHARLVEKPFKMETLLSTVTELLEVQTHSFASE